MDNKKELNNDFVDRISKQAEQRKTQERKMRLVSHQKSQQPPKISAKKVVFTAILILGLAYGAAYGYANQQLSAENGARIFSHKDMGTDIMYDDKSQIPTFEEVNEQIIENFFGDGLKR